MQPHWEEGTYPPLDPRARAAAAPDPCTLATITVEVERGSESERGRESERREWISWGDGATEGVDRVDWLGLVSYNILYVSVLIYYISTPIIYYYRCQLF